MYQNKKKTLLLHAVLLDARSTTVAHLEIILLNLLCCPCPVPGLVPLMISYDSYVLQQQTNFKRSDDDGEGEVLGVIHLHMLAANLLPLGLRAVV